ncbi:hypothetical protein [Klugiella xanthotipulae]|uniref:Uncharacterized protein n=1 Tax=Klugiella xanthotipulae TaxID=244735 RepID=A0A543I6D4_9MICO|nr:hypothetical protein [Klugiella xanthotipulae]TQM66144.1 hypothetical protein FB466_0974 [Klugiella xanthotipulae]
MKPDPQHDAMMPQWRVEIQNDRVAYLNAAHERREKLAQKREAAANRRGLRLIPHR